MQTKAIKVEGPLDSENTYHSHINTKMKFEELRLNNLIQEQTLLFKLQTKAILSEGPLDSKN